MNCTRCGTALPPGSGFCGACGTPVQQQQPAYAPPPQAPQLFGSLRPYPIVMHRGMTRLTGQLYVAPARLYFLCESNKGGLAVALGKGVGGLIGGAIAAAGAPTPGQSTGVADEGS